MGQRTRENLIRKNIRPPKIVWDSALREKVIETRVGGFWYGNIRYPSEPKKYCELWNEDLRERIRAYWGYVSALSGDAETCRGAGGAIKTISCHHVYYQKKACCGWDADYKGYYADIDAGTVRNPLIVRHYIEGDPNKFVTLTAKEHKATDFNRMRWIKTFEKLIEDQGGKCYFTKEDIEKLLAES